MNTNTPTDNKAMETKEIGSVIEEALKSYRCQYTVEEDDLISGMPLADVLSPPDDLVITRGLAEIEQLADYIAGELIAAGWNAHAAALSQSVDENGLKPCPWCHRSVALEVTITQLTIRCENGGCPVNPTAYWPVHTEPWDKDDDMSGHKPLVDSTRQEAIESWNNRRAK